MREGYFQGSVSYFGSTLADTIKRSYNINAISIFFQPIHGGNKKTEYRIAQKDNQYSKKH